MEWGNATFQCSCVNDFCKAAAAKLLCNLLARAPPGQVSMENELELRPAICPALHDEWLYVKEVANRRQEHR